jgi:uncharacterized protein YndB with AHSA1/START domain
MANEYELAIDVDASPDATWAVVGDLGGVPRWFVKYPECTVDGDTRTLVNAEGGKLVERILERDDAERRYSYSVIEGPPLASHWASFAVVPRDGGSTILWNTKATFLDASIDPEERLAAGQRDALERLKALCESA